MTTYRAQIRAVLLGLGLTFGSFVLGSFLIFLAAQLLMLLGIPVSDRPAVQLGLSTILLQGVTFGAVALAFLRYRGLGLDFISVRIPTARDLALVFGGTIGLYLLLGALSVIISLLGLSSAQNQVVTIAAEEPAVFLLLIPLSFLLIGPGEELLFRGLIQGTFREVFSPVRAIVLASLVFGSIHLVSLQGSGKLVYVAIVFVLALILGATYEYTDNLVVPALIHGAYNAIQFGVAYYTISRGIEIGALF